MKRLFIALLFVSSPVLAAFPTVESTSHGVDGSTTPVAITLPATISADAVIIACLGLDGSSVLSTAESGVSVLGQGTIGTGTAGCFCKAADGTEDGTTWDIAFDGGGSEFGTYMASSIQGSFDDTCSSVATATFATADPSTDANPPDLNPGLGVLDFLWIPVGGIDWVAGHVFQNYPADCADNQIAMDGAGGVVELAICTRNFASASWDPAAFVWDDTGETIAGTMAVRPAAAASSNAAVLGRRR